MSTKNPCFGCTRREVGCHSTCIDHQKWTEKEQAKKAVIQAARNKQRLINSDVQYRHQKMSKKKMGER